MLKRKGVTPYYGRWCATAPSGDTCYACLAGGVMIGTLAVDPDRIPERGLDPNWSDFPPGTARALYALNQMRESDFHTAYNHLGRQGGRFAWLDDALDKHREKRLQTHRSVYLLCAPFFIDRAEFAKHLDSLEPVADIMEQFERRPQD